MSVINWRQNIDGAAGAQTFQTETCYELKQAVI